MQDRDGNTIKIGDAVKIIGLYNLPLQNCWIIKDFIDQGLAIEAVLCHYYSDEIMFVHVLDLEKCDKRTLK